MSAGAVILLWVSGIVLGWTVRSVLKPARRMIVISREGIFIDGEKVYPLPSTEAKS